MSSSARPLPPNPDLRHLKDQARDLLRAGQATHLAEAQFRIARGYGFDSWPKLKAHVEALRETGQLKAAIDANDLERVKEIMIRNPALHRAPLGYGKNGPLTWVAECRVPREAPRPERLEMARWMIEQGSDVHQGGDGPLMRATLSDERLPMAELLVAHGADVNAVWNGHYPIVLGPCECLAPRALAWLLDQGADPHGVALKHGSPLGMLLVTYARDAARKAACLAVLAAHGLELPDTPTMALHRRRFDLLGQHLERHGSLLSRSFTQTEIFPPELGAGEGLTATPVDGGTLLHLAIELDDLESASWLMDRGADPNARAAIDADGFGGHTPLFHAVVSLGRRDDAKARFLLGRGADPNVRATIRKQLRDMGDQEKEALREFPNVTALGYARRYQEPEWVSEPALAALVEYGGGE